MSKPDIKSMAREINRRYAVHDQLVEALDDARRWLEGVLSCYGEEALGESKPVNCMSLGEIKDLVSFEKGRR